MNKPLEPGQLAELQTKFPVEEAPAKLTRAQKLNHLADLVAKHAHFVRLGHNIERRTSDILALMPAYDVGALELASLDKTFLKDGLKATLGPNEFSIKDVRDYLELTTGELHEFSCDCGGQITPSTQADRIRGLADRGPPQSNFLFRAVTSAFAGT